MRRTRWLLLALAFAACLPDLGTSSGGEDNGARSWESIAEGVDPPRPTVAHLQPLPRSVLATRPSEMAEAVEDGYRTPPDRRFLMAVAWMDRLITGQPPGEVVASWDGEQWVVRYREETVGTLRNLPAFSDALTLLRTWAASRSPNGETLPERHPGDSREIDAIRAGLRAFDIANVSDAMRRLDALWRAGRQSAESAHLATEGLLSLVLQSYDRLELGDVIPAKALATMVWTEVATGRSHRYAEALLAAEMGYTRHADSAAAEMPRRDPVSLYVGRRNEELRGLAEVDDAAPFVRYLYTLRLSAGGDPVALQEWTDHHGLQPGAFGLAQLKPALAMGRFENDAELAPLGPYIALYDLWKIVLPDDGLRALADARIERLSPSALRVVGRMVRDATGISHGLLARRFETDVALLAGRFEGPFLDAATFRAYFAAHFYSAEYQLARHILDGYSSIPLAQDLSRSFEGAPEGPARELHRWYRNLADATGGDARPSDLMTDLTDLRLLGRRALDRTYEELKRHLPYGDPRHLSAGKAYAGHLDSRVGNRYRIAVVLRDDLRDLARVEPYYRAIMRDSRRATRVDMWMTRYVGDLEALLEHVRDPGYGSADRMYGWGLLVARGEAIHVDTLRVLARQILASTPDNWSIRSDYVDYLERREDYSEALEVIDDWLARNDRSDGFPYIFARTARARVLYHQGRYEEAWRAVEPVVGSGQAGATGRGALVLERLGEGERALRMAESLLRRYPNNGWGRAVLAELLWRRGRFREAAEALDDPGHPLSYEDWRDHVVTAFLSAFEARPISEGREAFLAMLQMIPSWELETVARGIRSHGEDLEMAFAMHSALEPTRAVGSLRYLILPYWWLEELQGEDAALRWIRERLPPARRNSFSVVAYGEGAHDLLWTVIDEPERRDQPSTVWLMRAAAHTEWGENDRPGRREALLEYYEGRTLDDPYDVMGAYLMGLVDQERLFQLGDEPDRRCEIAYYLGLRAEVEGRMADAVAWHRVVLETQQTDEFEYRWSTQRLDGWRNQGRALEEIILRYRSG